MRIVDIVIFDTNKVRGYSRQNLIDFVFRKKRREKIELDEAVRT